MSQTDRKDERFAGLLLRYRGRAGLTQQRLASQIGVTTRAVQGWENGVMYPRGGRLQALIGVLLGAGGLQAGRELEEAEALWAAVRRESAHAHPPFEKNWFSALQAERVGAHDAARVGSPTKRTRSVASGEKTGLR